MPIYEYQCKNCGVFEATQRITEEPLKECPTCHGSDLHRLISHTSFVLKGSGWYATDYASKGSGTKSDAGDEPAKPAASDASGNSSSNGSAPSGDSTASSSTDSSAKSSSDKSATSKPAA